MAEVNQAAQELAEVLQRVTEEMRQYGRVSQETDAALRAGGYRRARDLDAAAKLTANALGDVAGAGISAAKSLYAGQQGAAQFNSALDGMTKAVTAAGAALTFLVPGGFLIKALIGLGTAATVTTLEMTKAANEMANKLFDANVKMARSGAAASDGLTGLYSDAKKLGLSMNQLGVYADVVSGNAAELALFRGSVFEGRKAFANIGKSMEPFRQQLEGAGIQLEDQIAGTAGYLRLQTQIGMSQNMTTQQLALGARQYLLEMDGLSKLTGQQRQDIEKQMEAARNEQRFRAKLDAMRSSGDARQIAAADKLERANILISKQAPELAQAFRDSASGVLSSDAAVKGMIGTNGELLRATDQLTSGAINEYEAFQMLGRAAGQFAKDMNFTAQLGLLNDFSIDYAQAQRISIAAQRDISVLAGEIKTEQDKQLSKENDQLAQEMAAFRERNRQNNELAEQVIFNQIASSLRLGQTMNDAMTPLIEAFNKLTPLINRFREFMDKMLRELVPKLERLVGGVNKLLDAKKEDMPRVVGELGLGETVGQYGGAYAGLKAGAALGAGFGSVFGPVGTVVGGLLGGAGGAAAGYFGGGAAGRFADRAARGEFADRPLGSTSDEMSFGVETPAQGRAKGGPVSARTPYLVGERGPELYVPEQSGDIVNTDKLSQMSRDLTSLVFGNRQKFNQTLQNLGTNFQTVTVNSRKVVSDSKEIMTDYSAVVQTVEEFKNINQQNTQLTKDFADQYRIYIEKCTDILKKNMQQMETQGPLGTAGMAGMPGAGGQGIVPQAPAAGAASGQGLQIRNQDDLSKLGLRIKRGDVQGEGAKISPKLLELAQQIQRTIPEFNVFTGFNDLFHQERHPSSAHTRGLAMDFTLSGPPTKEAGQDIVDYLKGLGFSYVADEYNRPNQFTTGGHFHAQLPEFAEGGVTQGPTIAGEKDAEAVVPLPDGRTIPVRIMESHLRDKNSRVLDLQNFVKVLPKEMAQALSKVIDFDIKKVLPTAEQSVMPAVKVIDNLMPDVGQAVNEQLKEVNLNVANSQSLSDMLEEIKTSLASSLGQLAETLDRKSNSASEQLVPLLENLVRTGRDQVDVSNKILHTSY